MNNLYLVRFANGEGDYLMAPNALEAARLARLDITHRHRLHGNPEPQLGAASIRQAAYGELECAGQWFNDGSHICSTHTK